METGNVRQFIGDPGTNFCYQTFPEAQAQQRRMEGKCKPKGSKPQIFSFRINPADASDRKRHEEVLTDVDRTGRIRNPKTAPNLGKVSTSESNFDFAFFDPSDNLWWGAPAGPPQGSEQKIKEGKYDEVLRQMKAKKLRPDEWVGDDTDKLQVYCVKCDCWGDERSKIPPPRLPR